MLRHKMNQRKADADERIQVPPVPDPRRVLPLAFDFEVSLTGLAPRERVGKIGAVFAMPGAMWLVSSASA
jgi:hypothetical protein